jgi:D-glycero-alpha-D-manno-heptose-7-phosphate kinase
MIITKSPFRLSLFGGSSDYKEFYEEHGSFLIGTTIDKYNYLSIRRRPRIMPKKSILTYSKFEEVEKLDEITNPLIRETLKYFKINFPIECNSFTDIPGRTGLGGSSSYCVGLSLALRHLIGLDIDKRTLAEDAIMIERIILQESGGIQDQIWAAYGGFNSIEISPKGWFEVKPLPVTEDFTEEFQNSMLLIYTGAQRFTDSIAKSHENKDKTNILNLSKMAYESFIKQDIKTIGELLYSSWKEKPKFPI